MKKSIIQDDMTQCYLCGSMRWLETHHVFGAANRKNSDKYGLVVRLCHYCHNEKPRGVHYNKATREYLQREGQAAFMREFPDLDFMKIFGRNYIL